MIKELKQLQKKYGDLTKRAEYVSTYEVAIDLYRLIQECRLKRIPKDKR